MKRMLAFVTALVCVFSCAAAGYDLASMSYEELLALQDKLSEEIASRPERKEETALADVPLIVYRMDTGTPIQVNPSTTLETMGLTGMLTGRMADSDILEPLFSGVAWGEDVFYALPDSEEILLRQYEIAAGRLPAEDDEIVVIINSRNELGDPALFALGLKDQRLLTEKFTRLMLNGTPLACESAALSAGELMELQFRLLYNTSYYEKEEGSGIWTDKRRIAEYVADVLANDAKSMALKVVGVIRTVENTAAASMAGYGGIGYRGGLRKRVLDIMMQSDIVREQTANRDINIFTGAAFDPRPKDARVLLSEMMETDDGRSVTQKMADFISLMEELGILPAGMLPEWIIYALTPELIYTAIEPGTVMIPGTSYEENLRTLGVYTDDSGKN